MDAAAAALRPGGRDRVAYGAVGSANGDLPGMSAGTLETPSPSTRSPRRLRRHSSLRAGVQIKDVPLRGGRVWSGMTEGVWLGLSAYSNWWNVLLLFAPFGIGGKFFGWSDEWIFICNFLAMIPLAMILSKSTEDIAEHTSDTVGALANCTFGNAVEIILSIAALEAGLLDVVKNTLVGSVLSNLLLVLGCSFFFGGLFHREQFILPAVSDSNSNLLTFAVFGFVIPAIFAYLIPEGPSKQGTEEIMSLVCAVCLLTTYCLYLLFQLHTHAQLYQSDVETGPGATPSDGEDEEAAKVASLPMAVTVLVLTVGLVSVCSELLVGSLEGFSKSVGLGESFIALVLLPVIGNSVEHFSAITVAVKNNMDLAIGIACGSSVQIALFAAPVLVLISWALPGPKLTLNFHLFETFCVCFSVLTVNATLRDSRSNWLEGVVLTMCYVILAAAFFLVD